MAHTARIKTHKADRTLSSQTYWQKRFHTEESFEWLGLGEVLLTRGLYHLGPHKTPRALHIGSGSSSLGCTLRSEWAKRQWAVNNVVNVDYAPSALDRSRAAEIAQFGDVQTRHEECDLLDYDQVQRLQVHTTLILDKSTADCISTLEAVNSLQPVTRLARNLASICGPGSIWAVLSYSSARDEDVLLGNEGLWTLVEKYSIIAPSGSADPHAPSCSHWCYFFRRNETS